MRNGLTEWTRSCGIEDCSRIPESMCGASFGRPFALREAITQGAISGGLVSLCGLSFGERPLGYFLRMPW
jgi:hypothetical protein